MGAQRLSILGCDSRRRSRAQKYGSVSKAAQIESLCAAGADFSASKRTS